MKIAITGKMCSGKSSIASVLLESDDRYQIYSFGHKVKDVAKDLFDMKEKDIGGITVVAVAQDVNLLGLILIDDQMRPNIYIALNRLLCNFKPS